MVPAALALLGWAGSVSAAPKLRLTTAAVGPVVVATGTNGPEQRIEAYNAGDGALSLAAGSNVDWLGAEVGESAGCALRAGLCTPVRIKLNTAGLAKGQGLVVEEYLALRDFWQVTPALEQILASRLAPWLGTRAGD